MAVLIWKKNTFFEESFIAFKVHQDLETHCQ